jgi:DNA-binding transcriptional regulator LsrR (DeoR family)
MHDELNQYQEINLLARCAHLYYRKNKSQQEIAKALSLTRSKVSRYMKRLLTEKWVEISFDFPVLPELAARLCVKYGLRDAVVVPTGEKEYLKADIGQAAARFFERVVGNNASVGLSCGMTLYEMVRQISRTSAKDIKIYPLAADSSYESVDIFPNTLVGMLAAKLRPQATAYALPAQMPDDSSKLLQRRKEILAQPNIKKILSEAEDVDIAFIGVGAIESGVLGFCSVAEQYGWSCGEIREQTGAVADYNYTLIDDQGKSLMEKPEASKNKKFEEITNRIINISLESVRRITTRHGKFIVCLAGGKDKLTGIHAVLKGGLANVLITDFETAIALLGKD